VTKPTTFSDSETKYMQGALDDLRTATAFSGSYMPRKWMVSSFNRRPDVLQAQLPDRIVVRDITLRTTEQLAGADVSPAGRLNFLREVVRAGVGSVQLSTFRRGHSLDEMRAEVDAVKEINPACEVVYGAATTAREVELAAKAGIDSVHIWTAFLGAGAAICSGAVYHRVWQDRDWRDLNFPLKPEDQIERSVRMCELGKEWGVGIGGTINLLSYASEAYISEYSGRVAEAGAVEIALADGSSGCGPEAIAHAVQLVRASAPEVPVGLHTHNMFGLGTANLIAGVKAGAEVIEVAVNEYEHGATQADLAATVAALEVLYGIPTGVALDRLVPLARLAEDLTGQRLADHHPITGRKVFEAAGGDEYVQEYKYDVLIHCALAPELVGNVREASIARDTGPLTMWDRLDAAGVEVTNPATVEQILVESKRLVAEKRRDLTAAEVRALAQTYLSKTDR